MKRLLPVLFLLIATGAYALCLGTNPLSDDVTKPTVSSRAIPSAGDKINVALSETCTTGGTYSNSDWTVAATDGAPTVTALAWTGNTAGLTLSRTIYSTETVTIAYAGGTIKDGSNNTLDLWSAGSGAVTNGSTANGASTFGNTNAETNVLDCPAGAFYIYRVQASASGSLGTGHVYLGTGNGVGKYKIIVYSSSSSTPQSGDSLVGVSSEVTTNYESGAWLTGGTFSSGSVVSGNYYWVGIMTNTANYAVYFNEAHTGTVYYISDFSSSYASPPSTLSGLSFGNSASHGPASIYIGTN